MMDDIPFIDPGLFIDLDPDFFTTCGRALFIAQHFEKNLRAITAALDLRKGHISGELGRSDKEGLSEFYSRKLNRTLGRAINDGLRAHLPETLAPYYTEYILPPLERAREARNRIAHEFLFGFDGMEAPSEVLNETAEALRDDVHALADADFSVCCLIQGFNGAPVPCNRERYVRNVIEWVLSPLKHLLDDSEPDQEAGGPD